MSFRLPTPPPGSPFRVSYDEDGRLRLSWRVPFRWLPELAVFAGYVGAGAFVAAFTAHIAGPLVGPVAGFGVTLLFGCAKVGYLLVKLTPHRLLLDDSVLRYNCCPDVDDMAAPHQPRAGTVLRAEVGAIRLVRVTELRNHPPRPRLALYHGTGLLQLGRGLRESDLEWLAAVLRDWAAGATPSRPVTGMGGLGAG